MSRNDALTRLHKVVIDRRAHLRKSLANDLATMGEQRVDDEDVAGTVQIDFDAQLAQVESRELKRIDYALERMRDGQYGKCEGCGNNIPLARLKCLPCATCCIQCQRRREQEVHDLDGEVELKS